MKKFLIILSSFALVLAIASAMNMDNISAEKIDEGVFTTREEAEEYIANYEYDASKYTMTSSIEEGTYTKSGITAEINQEKDPEGKGYYVTVNHDEKTGYPSEVIVTITGGVKTADIDFDELAAETTEFAYHPYYMQPGDDGSIKFKFVNESGDDYVVSNYTHDDSDISYWGFGDDGIILVEPTEENILAYCDFAMFNMANTPFSNYMREKHNVVKFEKDQYIYSPRTFYGDTATEEEKANAVVKSPIQQDEKFYNEGPVYRLSRTVYQVKLNYSYSRTTITAADIPEGVTPVTVTTYPSANENTYNNGPYYKKGSYYYRINRSVSYSLSTLTSTQANSLAADTIINEVATKPSANEATYNAGPYYAVTKYVEVTRTENPNYYGNYATKDEILAYFNDTCETEMTDLVEAWKYYFFNKCWQLEYQDDWKELDLSKDANIETDVTWKLDGPLTDNEYQNTCWGWNDTLSIECPDIEAKTYTANVVLTRKPADVEEPDPKPGDDTKPTKPTKPTKKANAEEVDDNSVDTGDHSNVLAYELFAALSAAGAAYLISKKNK